MKHVAALLCSARGMHEIATSRARQILDLVQERIEANPRKPRSEFVHAMILRASSHLETADRAAKHYIFLKEGLSK